MLRRRRNFDASCGLLAMLTAAVAASWLQAGCDSETGAETGATETVAETASAMCRCELRSWVVAGRGRHLFLDIECPEPFDELRGVVEFATTSMRRDFDWTLDPEGISRISRMEPGQRVLPAMAGPPDDRLEATFELTTEQAACLLRDRLYSKPYFILGPNSNSAMRAACEDCELELPEHVQRSGGALGEFPGIEQSPGHEIPRESWQKFGWKAVTD